MNFKSICSSTVEFFSIKLKEERLGQWNIKKEND